MTIEAWVQEGITQKLRVALPDKMRVAGMGGMEGGSGLANIAAQVFVGHIKSRATAQNQQPHVELETFLTEVRIHLKALKGSSGAADPLELDTDMMILLGSVKNCLRGFKPVHPVVQPITIASVDLKNYEGGIWDWSVVTQITLRRFEGEQFKKVDVPGWVDGWRNGNDVPLPFDIENLSITSGVYRSEIDRLDTSYELDSESTVYIWGRGAEE